MKKITIRSPGSYDKLELVDAPNWVAEWDQVVIDVHAIGVNFADVCVRLGVYESAKKYVGWPITPGFEVSGTVRSVGPTVTKYRAGQKVVAFTRFDAYATQVRVPESQVLPLPDGFSLIEGAAFPVVFFTAYHAIYQHVVLPRRARVLIHSAAGGVGTTLVQLCKSEGFHVTGVIGLSHKRAYLEKFDPDVIIDKSTQDLWAEAKKASPEGFHAVFDANGYSTLRESYNHLCPTGKLIAYGSHDLLSKKGGSIPYLKAVFGLLRTPRFNPLDMITSNRGVVGFNVSFLFDEKERIAQCIEGLQRKIEAGSIRPIPVTSFAFEQVADAHRLIESGQSVGKVVLTV